MTNILLKRYQWLDILKGIGIILIMLSHACKIPYLGIYLWSCYLPLFFMVSGYTFNPNLNVSDEIKKKAKRLLFPYFFYGFLFTLLHTIISDGNISLSRWIGVLYGRLNLYSHPDGENIKFLVDGPLWFLPALFLSYLLSYLYTSLNSVQKWVYIFFSFIYTYICTLLPIYLPWCIDEVFIASLFIISVYEFKDKEYLLILNFKFLLYTLLMYVLLVTLNGNINMAFRIYGNWGCISVCLFFLIGILGTLIWYCISKKIEYTFIGYILSYIGKISLRLMCIHIPLFTIMDILLKISNKYLMAILNIIVAIIISSVIEKICLRFKIQFKILAYI